MFQLAMSVATVQKARCSQKYTILYEPNSEASRNLRDVSTMPRAAHRATSAIWMYPKRSIHRDRHPVLLEYFHSRVLVQPQAILLLGAGNTKCGIDPIVDLGLKVEWASYLRDPHPLKVSQGTTWLPESPSKDSASPHLACRLQELHHRDVKMHPRSLSTAAAGPLFYFCAFPPEALETQDSTRHGSDASFRPLSILGLAALA